MIKPNNIPIVVVLPHPLGPNKAKVWFFLILKLILLTASMVSNFFCKFLTSIIL